MSLFMTGSKGAKFLNVGDSITGRILAAPTERQQTKFGTQEPDFWPDGQPKMQIVVPLGTDLRDPADPHDDGERTLYVASKHMKRAIGDAMRVAGVPDVAVGGTLTVTYVGNDPNSKNPANPAKLYQAQYSPPASGLAAPGGAPAQGQAAPQVQAGPVQAAPGGMSADQHAKVLQLRAAGIDDGTIQTAVGITADQLAAVPF